MLNIMHQQQLLMASLRSLTPYTHPMLTARSVVMLAPKNTDTQFVASQQPPSLLYQQKGLNQHQLVWMKQPPHPHRVVNNTLDDTLPHKKFNLAQKKKHRASAEQLEQLRQKLAECMPHFFKQPHDYSLYTNDVAFIDNTRQFKVEGLSGYVLQLNLFKVANILRYSKCTFHILNIVVNLEESSLRIRWRVDGKPGLMYMIFFFWRLPHRDSLSTMDSISTLYVNRHGKIDCHVRDNIETKIDTHNQATNGIKQLPFLHGINKNST